MTQSCSEYTGTYIPDYIQATETTGDFLGGALSGQNHRSGRFHWLNRTQTTESPETEDTEVLT